MEATMGSRFTPHHSLQYPSPDLTLTLTQQPLSKQTLLLSNKLSKCSLAQQKQQSRPPQKQPKIRQQHQLKLQGATTSLLSRTCPRDNKTALNFMKEETTASKTVSWSTLYCLVLQIPVTLHRLLGFHQETSRRSCPQACLTSLDLHLALWLH